MNQKKRYFVTGLFVFLGFALFVVGCILFGGSELFAKKLFFETYFATSVQGLDAGGAVKFRGVPVGKVEQISFVGDHYTCDEALATDALTETNRHHMLAYIRVLCSIDQRQFPSYTPERLTEMVQRGLRSSLGMQGITGIVFVNLDYEEPNLLPLRDLKIAWQPEELYIPSTPTVLQNIVDIAEDLCEKLDAIDFPKTIESLTHLAEDVDRAVTEADLPKLTKTFTQFGEALTQQTTALAQALEQMELGELGKDLHVLTENMADVSKTMREALPGLAERADGTMLSVQEVLGDMKGTLHEMSSSIKRLTTEINFAEIGEEAGDALSSLSRTAASMEALVDEIRERPSRLFFSDSEEE